MSAEVELPLDHPMRAAWERYKLTPEYANSRKWAAYGEHVDGSLWAAFCQGFQSSAPTDAEERGRLKGIEQAANLMDRLSQGSVEGGLLERGVGVVLRSAGGQLAKHIRALAGKTEKEPTP